MPNIFPPINDPNVSPVLPAYQSPVVSGPPTPLQAAQAKLQADTPQKYDYSSHGVLGNVGHVLERFGNIAGDVLDPGATSLIPGSDLFKARQQHQDQALIQQAQQQQDEEQKEKDAVANESANREAQAPLRESETSKNNAEAEASQHPTWQHIETDQGIFALNPKTNELIPLTNNGKPLMKAQTTAQKPDSPEQQYIDEYQKKNPGASIADAERHFKIDTTVQQPPQALIFAPGANGGFTAQAARPGSAIAPGSVTSGGMNSENAPTAMQRNAGGRAQLVLDQIPGVLDDLEKNKAQLGPGMGRFNDIYSGKIGAPNPEFAGLMADLHLMGTAVALAHAQGRMSNELLREFNDMIAAPHQSPENIKAVMSKVQRYMQTASQQGKYKPEESGSAADYHFVNGKLVKAGQ